MIIYLKSITVCACLTHGNYAAHFKSSPKVYVKHIQNKETTRPKVQLN
jgi:hypothetical protein